MDVGYTFKPEVDVPQPLDIGSVAYRSLTQDADGSVIASGSQLFLALSPPPADVSGAYSFFGKVEEGVEAVSYTHLDVYKRQVILWRR